MVHGQQIGAVNREKVSDPPEAAHLGMIPLVPRASSIFISSTDYLWSFWVRGIKLAKLAFFLWIVSQLLWHFCFSSLKREGTFLRERGGQFRALRCKKITVHTPCVGVRRFRSESRKVYSIAIRFPLKYLSPLQLVPFLLKTVQLAWTKHKSAWPRHVRPFS